MSAESVGAARAVSSARRQCHFCPGPLWTVMPAARPHTQAARTAWRQAASRDVQKPGAGHGPRRH
eukprot:6537140-Alexandrium_andersonii.AAC.1